MVENSKNANLEVERKFLVDMQRLPDLTSANVLKIEQVYFSFSPEMRVRSINDLHFFLTIKLPKDNVGLAREETELIITRGEYNVFKQKQVGSIIHKTRYELLENGFNFEVDIYSGELEGLCVAEVEFKNVKKANAFKPPAWFLEDVTSDLRYKNANLAKDGLPKG